MPAPLLSSGPAGPGVNLMALDEIVARARRAAASSPADETEIVWIEYRAGEEGRHPPERRSPRPVAASRAEPLRRDILVRIEERGRVGTHRTGDETPCGLEMGVRSALAQARVHDPLPGFPHLPNDAARQLALDVADPAITALWTDRQAATEFLRPLRSGDAEGARLRWIEGRVAVVNSRGLERAAAPTAATLEVRTGRSSFGAGAGAASASARSLAGLPVEQLLASARARTSGEPVDLPPSGAPVALSPEAAAQFLDTLARSLFSAHAYRAGSSLLRDHIGVQVFDRCFSLRDDALDPAGLPFAFDLEGTAKHAVDLVREGVPRTPTLDQRHAALLGLTATAHASGGDDAQPENLFLAPGTASDDELLAAAGDGVWLGRLDRVEVTDARRLQVRARGGQCRAVRAGRFAGWLPDLVWTVSPLHAFARLLAVGSNCRTLACGPTPGLFGATTAPGLVLAEGGELRLA